MEPVNSPSLSEPNGLHSSKLTKPWLILCFSLTFAIVAYLHAPGLVGYGYFLLLGTVFFALFDRKELPLFFTAYLVNGLLTALYFAVQIYNYPETSGTTSPFGAQTDDSYFFSLVADEVPSDMETRPFYYLYEEGFSNLVRFLTPFRIVHPLDVIFITSSFAGLLCVYTHQFALLMTGDSRVAKTAYFLCMLCPLLLMNGGAVLVRDTSVAGLVMLSLCCLHRGRFLAFLACTVLHLYVRPGTGLLILPVYAAIHFSDVLQGFRAPDARKRLAFMLFFLALFAYVSYAFIEDIQDLLESKTVDLKEMSRPGMLSELTLSGRGAYLWIQELPWPTRILLSTVYMFLNPFFTWTLVPTRGFDVRIVMMSMIYPLYILWVHAVAVAGLISRHPHRQKAFIIFGAFLVGCFLVGVYSLQSRHKTIIQPLYYVVAAIGWHWADPLAKSFGGILSVLWLLAQVAYSL